MRIIPNKGIHVQGDIIPMEKRGNILSSTQQSTSMRREMMSKSPRMMGKKDATKITR